MSFHIINCEQGSEEWHNARAGVITASMFCVARSRVGGLEEKQKVYVEAIKAGSPVEVACELAGYKKAPTAEIVRKALAGEQVSDFSEAAKNYAFRTAFERISRKPLDEGFETWQMSRGHDLEPKARDEHQLQTGLFVRRAGFVVTEDFVFGASADGLIDPEGGSEYKCLVSPEKLRAVLLDDDIADFVDQVQGCMWVTGRKWWHLCFYCPQLDSIDYPLHIVEMQRDDEYINTMERELLQFKLLVDRYERQLRGFAVANEAPFAKAA
ncbi:YqaJ-like viral recombinase domain protein [compost metagenome]